MTTSQLHTAVLPAKSARAKRPCTIQACFALLQSRRESVSAPLKGQAAEQAGASSGQHNRDTLMADAGKASSHQQAASDATEAAEHPSSAQQGDSQEGLAPESAASTSQSGAPGADGSAAGSPRQGAKPAQDSSGPSALKDSHDEEQQQAPLTPEEAAEKSKAESMRTARLATLAEQADIRRAPWNRLAVHHAVVPVFACGLMLSLSTALGLTALKQCMRFAQTDSMRTARHTMLAERADIR